MSHIPPDKLLPQDMVMMHDHGPRPFEHPVSHKMAAADARHAMEADPDRWTLEGDVPAWKGNAVVQAKPKKEK